jgi:RimJ/RimL family protein N-acetyltransferase
MPRLDDAAWLVVAARDPELVRFTDLHDEMTEADGVAWLQRRLDGWAAGWRKSFLIDVDGAPAGYVNLRIDHGRSVGEVGYWVAASHRHRGLMQQALRQVRDWSFDDLDLARLQATVQPENEPSCRTLLALGFQREGLLRSSDVHKGVRHDHWMFSLLRGDARLEWTASVLRRHLAGD